MATTRSLYRILFSSHFMLAAILLVGVGFLVYRQQEKNHRGEVGQRLRNEALFFADLVSSEDTTRWYPLARSFQATARIRITVMDSLGVVLFDTGAEIRSMDNHVGRVEFQDALHSGEGGAVRYSPTLRMDHMYYAVRVADRQGNVRIVRLAIPMQTISSSLQEIHANLGVIFFAALLLSLVVALALTRWIVKPIQTLREGAERFAQGQLDRRLPQFPWLEVQSLADSMNRMAQQLHDRIKSAILQRNETEAILRSMSEGVVALDHQGAVLRCNQAFRDLLGLHSQALIGRKLLALVRNLALESMIRELGLHEGPVIRDMSIHQEGEPRVLQVRGSVLLDLDRKEIGALVVFNDVTRLRKLEEMRRDFVANVSHELKTPITSIKGFVETLQASDYPSHPDVERFLGIILKQSNRLNAIVDDLLVLSRIEQGGDASELEFETVRLVDLCESVLQQARLISAEKKIRIQIQVAAELHLRGNPRLLEQALLNLVVNACRYSDAGKQVVVTAERKNNEIRLSVRDQGWGIPRQSLSRVFERFYRVDKARSRSLGGTGLGLAITKHIVLQHKGQIEVDSEVGVGSTFIMTFPFPDSP